ncbi:hypothetical protein GSS87_03145 [Corynebacterium sp. 4HC-13]|uniref:hypothetical protein n=1 Tax=Corynebacterium anserum TaxID=2684406 RepID=UPI0016399244|nr:hypothetical protein [Corynebacterium anserum]MBC2681403.1 hypothetical protein [Corynebacterium anserum]
MSAGDPKRKPQPATPSPNAADKTSVMSKKDAAMKPGTNGKTPGRRPANSDRYKGFKGFIRRMLEFMPLWAWILCFGLVMALILVGGAIITMSNLQVGNAGPDGKPSQVQVKYPAATTTGKYDNDTDKPAASQQRYVPDYDYQPEQTTSTTSESPKSTSSQSTKPSESKPKPSDTRPSSQQPSSPPSVPTPTHINPAPLPTSEHPSPNPGGGGTDPGNGGGNSPVEPQPEKPSAR